MKQCWKRLTAAAAALMMMLTMLPVQWMESAQAAEKTVGTVTADDVFLRKQPDSNTWWFKMPKGFTVDVLGQEKEGGVVWYKVNSTHPYSSTTNTYIGYVHGDFLTVGTASDETTDMDQEEDDTTGGAAAGGTTTGGDTAGGGTAAGGTTTDTIVVGEINAERVNFRKKPEGDQIDRLDKGTRVVILEMPDAASAWYKVEYDGKTGYVEEPFVTVLGTATNTNSQVNYGYVITTKTGVKLRKKPAGSTQELIDKGTVLPMTGASVTSGKYVWYPVRAESGKTGYLRGDCVTYCTSDGTATTEPSQGSGTVTNAPGGINYGYVMIKSPGVNVRNKPGGSSQGQVKKDTVWPMTAPSVQEKGYTWYPISAGKLKGYVRGDHAFKLSAEQEQEYLAGNGVTSGGSSSGSTGSTGTTSPASQYVQTVLDDVYLRAAATRDSEHKYQVDLGTVMAYNYKTTVGGETWYRVIYSNTEVWVLGECVKIMTEAEYKAYLDSNPSSTPQTQIIKGYVKTTESSVNVRVAPGSKDKLGLIEKGVVVPYFSTDTAKGYTWYYAKTSKGLGYLRDDVVMICDENGETVTPGTPGGSGNTGSGQEATYTTLRLGSKGTAVTNLVTELKIQGYYTGEITNTYTTAVVAAVKSFQTANNLDVDGIAGSKTQHKLFGTVPPGQGNSSDLTMTIYPAEKIDWYTGGIQQLWAKGSSYKVYDVKTGIVWWARRWSGAYHADVEPLTAADTARLCRIYGVDDAQDIWDDNLWHRRPSLVTIGSRTFACSLFGMPHNYPDGDTIPDNNMKGQICIHFTNSRIHDSNQMDEDHQDAIEEAYQFAKNGIQ